MSNRLYYALKPFLPSRLRLALRRVRANRVRKACAQIWPIYEPSGRAPEGWPGWPEGKEFAFVLSHDVEGLLGLSRCRELAEMEMEYGFRSSFHFIPKGEYVVPPDLLVWLRKSGFEVAVHDLFHDGHLFRSREAFAKHAEAINRQLAAWSAEGFRAGFMLHKLDWLHALNINYDSSTFDVDPFEPQPDGVQTVFPFWVERPDPNEDALQSALGSDSRGPIVDSHSRHSTSQIGYMELPYTLVQDYNLFVVLQEPGSEVWRRKLRWLAGKGAMSLLLTHPDYMAMPGCPVGAREFPVRYYREFLEHVRTEYKGRYWHATPKDVAAYCRPLRLRQARPSRQVTMLTHSYYNSDNRVRRYAETLAKRGDDVRVFCLGSTAEVKARRWCALRGVKFLCLQSRETVNWGKWEHAWRLLRFFVRAFRALDRKNLPNGCDLLHVHNVPDFLVFAGGLLRYRGAKLILDIHDIVPEFYESKFRSGHGSVLVSMLRQIEAWSCRFAHHVIISNHLWKKTILGRSAPCEKVTALVNNVDLIYSRQESLIAIVRDRF